MHRVALVYNSAAGQHPHRRAAVVKGVAAVLERAGITVTTIPTHSVEEIPAQIHAAIHNGCDTILVCGGDGTVHHVLQSMVGTSAALGVIPLGTANALAMDLGLPRSPIKAARMLLNSTTMQVPLGRISYRDPNGTPRSHYFLVAAGIGPEAAFFARLDSRAKQRFGYLHYVTQAFRMLFTLTFPMFTAEFAHSKTGCSRSEQVSQLLTVRISNFGGLVRKLVPGAALGQDTLKVIAFKTRSRMQYLRFAAGVICGRPPYSSHIEVIECTSLECTQPANLTEQIFLEADGDVLGTVPARLEVVPDTITLLVPRR